MARRSGYITVDCDEVIDQIDDEDLLEECRERKLSPAAAGETVDMEIVQEAYAALERGHFAEAKSILDRIIFPKWKSQRQAEMELARLRHSQTTG